MRAATFLLQGCCRMERMRKHSQAFGASDGRRGEIALADKQTGYPDWCCRTPGLADFFVVNLAKDLK